MQFQACVGTTLIVVCDSPAVKVRVAGVESWPKGLLLTVGLSARPGHSGTVAAPLRIHCANRAGQVEVYVSVAVAETLPRADGAAANRQPSGVRYASDQLRVQDL